MAIDKRSRLNLIRAGYWMTVIYMVFLGLALVLEGAFLKDFYALGLIIVVLLGFYFWSYMGMAPEYKDERLAKAGGRAMTVSWFSVVLLMGILVMLSGRLPEITSAQLAGMILILMSITSAAANEWFKRSGDVKELSG